MLAEPALFDVLFQAMLDDDPIVRMRAADAVEKVTVQRPDLLQPYAHRLLGEVSAMNQQEVRWHLAQMLPRLDLTMEECATAVAIMERYLGDQSRIVKTCAMQALAELALGDAPLRRHVLPRIECLTETCSAATRSRGRKLLVALRAAEATS